MTLVIKNKTQCKLLEIKITMPEMKNILDGISGRRKIGEFENIAKKKKIHHEVQREKSWKKSEQSTSEL